MFARQGEGSNTYQQLACVCAQARFVKGKEFLDVRQNRSSAMSSSECAFCSALATPPEGRCLQHTSLDSAQGVAGQALAEVPVQGASSFASVVLPALLRKPFMPTDLPNCECLIGETA